MELGVLSVTRSINQLQDHFLSEGDSDLGNQILVSPKGEYFEQDSNEILEIDITSS